MDSKSDLVIKQITSEQTYHVRQPVLRKGRPIEDCVFENDDLPSTIHLGLFLDETLIAVATFLNNQHSKFNDLNQYQLRGMAVLDKYQGKGYGNLLLKHGEQLLLKKEASLIWFNARKMATGFYMKNGYRISGTPFEIPNIGTHYLMYKNL